MKSILSIALFVLVVGGLVLWLGKWGSQGGTASVAPVSRGKLVAAESSFDFGTLSMAKGKATHAFTIKNVGREAVLIGKLYTSCMCTESTLALRGVEYGPFGMPGHGFMPSINESISPGEEARVEAIFDPAAHGPAGIGRIERVVYLEHNAGAPLELRFQALVTP